MAGIALRSTMRIALVSCAKKKRATAAPAKDLYVSPLFRGLRSYAETKADRWYILSAKFGVLAPNKIIRPYNVTLNDMTRVERASWARRVIRQLPRVVPRRATVIVLAGLKYRADIEPFLRQRCVSVRVPFAGLSIGKQLSRLKRLKKS